jgi:dTDP-4-amino-4,6-dideoxygalactose transaminase
MLANDPQLAERAYAFHNNGRGRKTDSYDFRYRANGANLRMTEFQAALLLAGLERLEQQTKTRDENGTYLNRMLKEIPGISPAAQYPGATRNAYHLYMFRYNPEAFAGVPKATFLKALQAEGVPCSGGYSPLNKEPFITNMLDSRLWRAIYPEALLKGWSERNRCPVNDRLCEEAVWFTQSMLLATRHDMEQIVEAIRKIQVQAASLKKA